MVDSSESGPWESTETEGQGGAGDAGGESLEDAARDARDIAASRMREELGREPNAEEVDEWLRRHTESY